MSLEPINLDHWRAHIRATLDETVARRVELAISRDAAEQDVAVFPAIYIARTEGAALGPGNAAGLVVQAVDVSVDVIIMVQRSGSASGARAIDPLRELRRAVWQTLIGWTPPDCKTAVSLVRFADAQARDNIYAGVDRFTTRLYLSNR